MTDAPADERLTIMIAISGRQADQLKLDISQHAIFMTQEPAQDAIGGTTALGEPTVVWDGFLRDEAVVRVEGPSSLLAATLRRLADMADEAIERRAQEMPDGPGSLIESMIGPRP